MITSKLVEIQSMGIFQTRDSCVIEKNSSSVIYIFKLYSLSSFSFLYFLLSLVSELFCIYLYMILHCLIPAFSLF